MGNEDNKPNYRLVTNAILGLDGLFWNDANAPMLAHSNVSFGKPL